MPPQKELIFLENLTTRKYVKANFFLSQLIGLTKETALALRQTCAAMPELCRYLLNRCDFKYMLMGKIQSDNIKGRFSYVHQLSGANYYIFMRQLHESERKLRTISLLKYSSN